LNYSINPVFARSMSVVFYETRVIVVFY